MLTSTPEEVASVGEPETPLHPPRRKSITRFKDAAVAVLVKTGSIISLNKSCSPVYDSQRNLNANKPSTRPNGVDGGGLSIGSGPFVSKRPAPKEFVGG